MGQFLTILSKQKKPKQQLQFFKQNSLSKIKEYYSMYKNISDTFAIDDEEFMQIFGQNNDVFDVLDTDKNLLVDGLELFVGLALLSDIIKFDDKIEFLFGLFDFNDLKSLSKTDLEFLFLSSCTIVHKLFGIKTPLKQQWITEFIRQEFISDMRINISQIFRWVKHCDMLTMFLELISKKPQKNIATLLSSKIYLSNAGSTTTNTITNQAQDEWLLNYTKFMASKQKKDDLAYCDLRGMANWVYGIRSKDVRQFIETIVIDGSQWIVYFIGKIVVLYNVQSYQQKHYLEHSNQIISITCDGHMIATGEYGQYPAIKIWDARTLTTSRIISGVHRVGVHLLKFMKEGRYLVSCGCGERSAVLVYNLDRQEIVYSGYCQSPAVDIASLFKYVKKQKDELVIGYLYGVKLLSIESQQIKCVDMQLNYNSCSRVSCCALMEKNITLGYLQNYDDEQEKLIITGHQKGQIIVSKISSTITHYKLTQQNCQILNIIPTEHYIIIHSDCSYVHFYDIDLLEKKKIKSIDICQLSHNLSSYDVYHIKPLANNHLLVNTKLNDMFIIGDEKPIENLLKFKLVPLKYDINPINQIVPIQGIIRSHQVIYKDAINTNILYLGGDEGILWGINTKTHQLSDYWNIGECIEVLDGVDCIGLGTLIMVGTQSGKLYTRVNFSQSSYKIQFDSAIRCICLSNDHLMAAVGCKDCTVYILANSSKGVYHISKKITISEIPRSMKLIDKKLILLSTHKNMVYVLHIKDSHYKPIDNIPQFSLSELIIQQFYNVNNISLPMILGYDIKALVAARANNTIDIWRNADDVYSGNSICLRGHNSICSQLSMSEDQKYIYSSGQSDNMVVEWKVQFCIQIARPQAPKRSKVEKIENYSNQIIDREINFCMFTNNLLSQTYDQHLLVRGIENETLCTLFKGMMEEWKLINETPNVQHPPPTTLRLDYVFGVHTYSKRSTVHILNHPKRFIYFVSRFVVIYSPKLNQQQVYSGHRFKVTCLAPVNNEVIVSGESCYKPCIRVWSCVSLQTLQVIETVHRWGIIYLNVDKDMIVSYGFSSKEPLSFSFQQTNMHNGYVIATRNEKEVITSISINPFNTNQFVTTGYNNVTFWQSSGKNIYRQSICYTAQETITCCLIYPSTDDKYEVIVGSKKGQIGIIVNRRKYIILKQNAHSKQINLIKLVIREQQPYFITSSEDQSIKIWNRKFEPVYNRLIRKIQFEEYQNCYLDKRNSDKIHDRNLSVQSISFLTDSSELVMLLATRNGDIFEAIENLELKYENKQSPFFPFKYTLFLKSHSCQHSAEERKKIIIAHHPKYQILVTISEDQNLFFWDTERNRLIVSKTLGYTTYPTAMKFTKDGQFLIIGYSDGFLTFIDSKISKSLQGKTDEKYILPSLTAVRRENNREGSAILNIEISQTGEHLAVSFNNKLAKSVEYSQNEQSYISLFLNKGKEKLKHFSKMDNDKIFQKFKEIPRQHNSDSIYVTKNNKYGMAVYSIAFAECDGKFYLLIYYQLVDSNQNRLNFSNDGKYVVWDVNYSTVIANLDLISTLNWKKFTFPNSIYCKYQFYESMVKEDYQKQPMNNNLLIPYMSAMLSLSNTIILGSINGDLHVVKTSCLQYQNMLEHYPKEQEMFIAKTFPAHCAEINQIESNIDKTCIYTTSISDECVIKWKVVSDRVTELMETKQADEGDIFGEVPTVEAIASNIQYYQLKQHLTGILFNPPDFIDRIKVKEIIGRRGYLTRNNLKYDCNGRIIYSSGHSIVTYDGNTKDFIYLEDDEYGVCHEINLVLMSNDCRMIYSFHNGLRVTLVVWESNSKIPIRKLNINTICYVLLAALSKNNKKMLVYGLDKHRNAYLMMIDIDKQKILGISSYSHNKPWVIKALQFIPKSQHRFITCGAQSTKHWELNSTHLVYQQITTKPQLQKMINLSMEFIGDTLLTGCEEGSLIYWLAEPIRKSQHSDAVFILQKCSDNMVVSGGKDSIVLIWKIEQNNLFPVYKCKIDAKLQKSYLISNPNYEIQSLSVQDKNILIGTRTGSIYTLKLPSNQTEQFGDPEVKFIFYDNQSPKAFYFSYIQSQLYIHCISNNGQLNIYCIKDYQMVYENNFDRQTIDMIVSEKSCVLYIAFKSEIHCYSSILNKDQFKKQKMFLKASISIKNITNVVLSKNEKMLAVGILRNSDHTSCVEIYDVNSEQLFQTLFRIPISHHLQFIDFSINNKYVMIKTVDAELIRDLTNNTQNLSKDYTSKIEWKGYGLLYSPKTHVLRQNFGKSHEKAQLVYIIEIDCERHLLFDNFGGIYCYVGNEILISQSRLKLSEISRVEISNDMKYIAVGSEFDHNIIVFQMIKQ